MPTLAEPGTKQHRCNACGRFFDTEGELRLHEPECRFAKEATEAGRRDLEEQDRTPHPPSDKGL